MKFSTKSRYALRLMAELARYAAPIQADASVVARLDCLLSFATQAVEKNYCRPDVNDSQTIDIREGRHPVPMHGSQPAHDRESSLYLSVRQSPIRPAQCAQTTAMPIVPEDSI